MSSTSKAKRSRAETEADPETPGLLWRLQGVLFHLLVAAALGAGCVVAFSYMREYVDGAVAAPTAPPRVVFKNRPPWMTQLVAQQLADSFRPAKPRSVFDHDALVATTRRLQANPWIATVRQVRRAYGKGPGDTIEVDCDFRAPMALVRSGFYYWFVDANGVKLPERFQAVDVPKIMFTADGRTNMRIIDGVRTAPPALAGQKWVGEDLAAGLDMVRHLYGQPCAEDVVIVKVDNYAGRTDPRE